MEKNVLGEPKEGNVWLPSIGYIESEVWFKTERRNQSMEITSQEGHSGKMTQVQRDSLYRLGKLLIFKK